MANDDNQPATRKDLFILEKKIDNRFDGFEMILKIWKDEIYRHFGVISEDTRHDAMGANKDTIELIKDKQQKHDVRIRKLEDHVGMIT
ncbi:MAG: hypothetical protein QF809_03765 [Candidatus Peribacteraceae bacterium]|jgi:hypothetical protein|nr:hypothetical protein [Candidatus Peribacteraceae bacterium]MDP7645861.1 hypothetical protein [Candidatus Peribacteraceae bacterium]|tara:strand:+ start:405 stop:668 length:264 start_codon:yes stop_codon:yes gene_type:complete